MANPSATNKWAHQRTTPRLPHESNIVYKGRYGANQVGTTRDICEEGVYVVAPNPVTLGSELVLYIPIEVAPGKVKMCILSGRIVRQGSDNEDAGFAVKFDSKISADTKNKLVSFLNRKSDS